ncbi:MAG: hypothetical protein RDU20_00355 [Desulfomonilaceae bacterium]|nr:hypothetical protein [Desulfomonilaceae bacterium]
MRLHYGIFVAYLVYLLVRLLEEVLNLIPEKAVFAFARFVGRTVYVLFSDRRAGAVENLTIAFGSERSKEWIALTARKSFEHVGLLAAEFFLIRRWTQKDMAERIVLEGKLPYDLAMMPGNDGILLLNSHFGCFEVSAATTKFLGMRLNLIATPLKNPFLSRYFETRAGGAEDTGIHFHPHKGSAKTLIDLMRGGHMVACLADQRGDVERGVMVDFFGTKAPANEIFAKFAIDGRARVLPLCTIRMEDGRYKSIFGEDIRFTVTGDQRTDLITVSQLFHNQFEQWLRMKPEQGFWLQRKWRRKPRRKRSRKKLNN